MRHLLSLLLLLLGAGCRPATYLVVTLTTSGPTLDIGVLEVNIESGAHTGTVTYTQGTSFSVPPDQSFVLQFDGDVPTDEVTLDLVARRGGGVLASTLVKATLRRGETVHVTARFGPAPVDAGGD